MDRLEHLISLVGDSIYKEDKNSKKHGPKYQLTQMFLFFFLFFFFLSFYPFKTTKIRF